MNPLVTALIIVAFVVLAIAIVALVIFAIVQRRRALLYKKADYLIEDVTYKSEMLTSTVETVAKMADYIDVFEVVAKKNIKSAVKLLERNKDDIYKIGERIKKAAMGKDTKKEGKK